MPKVAMNLTKFVLAVAMLLGGPLHAQTADSAAAVVAALQAGGKVIVLRHTNSPRELPQQPDPENVNGERQLDAKGREDAQALGAAWSRLGIRIAEVRSSPAYRAQQMARLAGFDEIIVQNELGNDGMRDASEANAAWLRAETERVSAGGNRLLITHGPNIGAAFSEQAGGMGEGDALVFDPARGAFVGRIGIGEWPAL